MRGVSGESEAVRRAQSFSFSHTGLLFLWGHLFAAPDVTHANLGLINQCSESDTSYKGEQTVSIEMTFYAHGHVKGEVALETLIFMV